MRTHRLGRSGLAKRRGRRRRGRATVCGGARVWPDAVAYILCECDLSHRIGDGRLKNVGQFRLNGPFSFLWLFEPILQIIHLFFF
jgi:hypothetical protein